MIALSEKVGRDDRASARVLDWIGRLPVVNAAGRGPTASGSAIQHYLSAVYQALDLPAPHHSHDRLPYLNLLEQRAGVARASIGRLAANQHTDELDYTSEGDHILHQIADMPPDTYRHSPARRCPGKPG